MNLHYLSIGEEKTLKRTIPYEDIDERIRHLVSYANKVDGLATLQSCGGHVIPKEDDQFEIQGAHIAFRATREIADKVIFDIAPRVGIMDVEIRYFNDGVFWILTGVDPSEHQKLFDMIDELFNINNKIKFGIENNK